MFRNILLSRFWLAVLLAGLVVALAQTPQPVRADDKPPRTISLTGMGAVKTQPDMAHISTGVVSDAGGADKALADNTKAMTQVVAGLKASGIEPKDIQTTNFSVQPRYSRPKDGRPHSIVGYRVVNTVAITVRDLKALGSVLDQVVRLGSNQIGGIRFSVSNAEELKDAARKKAMADARRKADLYMAAAGAKLGKVMTISEDFISHPPPRPMMARTAFAEKADVAIEPGEQSLEVRVNVTWALE